jgi:trimethylamine:corrinoid methyltransferase-like protein
VRVDSPEIVRLLAETGARVTDESIVHIPQRAVEWALRVPPHGTHPCRGESWRSDPTGRRWC